MKNLLEDPELFYKVQGYIAFGIGLIVSLSILIPTIKKKRRVSRIIKNGKRKGTFILGKRVYITSHYEGINEDGSGRNYKAKYEYEKNGEKHKYLYIGLQYPKEEIPFYYDEDKNDAHPENEEVRFTGLWSLPFVIGIIVGVTYFYFACKFVQWQEQNLLAIYKIERVDAICYYTI